MEVRLQKIGLCEKCSKRDTCTEPCAAVEEFLLKGTRKEYENELPAEFVRQYKIHAETDGRCGEWPKRDISKKELILKMYFADERHYTHEEIAIHAGCSKSYVTQVINRAKLKV